MYSRGKLICRVEDSNKVYVETPLDDMKKKVRERLDKRYEFHKDVELAQMTNRPGTPLTKDQLDGFADRVGKLVSDMTRQREFEKLLGAPEPAGFCMGMTTLWLREVAFHHNEESLTQTFKETATPESNLHKEARGIQESFQAKMQKRYLLTLATQRREGEVEGVDLKRTQQEENERIAVAVKTDKKAGLASELIKNVRFPFRKEVFLEEFHTLSESVMKNDDIYRLSFQYKLGAHAMGLYSTGSRVFLMDPNLGVFRYVDSKHLDEDLADAFYDGGYMVECGESNYTLFKLRKVAAAKTA